MLRFLLALAAAIAHVGASLPDEAALVQIHKSELSHKGGKAEAGKQFVIEVYAEVFRRRDHIDCMLETDIDKVCHETSFDITVNGRTLTFVFRPGQPYIRIDGKIHDELLGWSPDFSTRKGRQDEAHHPTSHKLTITLRSTGIHTLKFEDGLQGSDRKWSKDFHHTRFFPEDDKAVKKAKVKTSVKNKNLRKNMGHYKCYSGYNEVHCMTLRKFGPAEDMPEPYESTHIPHVTNDFAFCNGYGDPHYLTYKEKRHHFQGIGTYTFSKSGDPDMPMTVQVFNCPLQRRPPKGGFVSLTAGIVIKIGDYYKISKVGEITKLISQGETKELPPDEYVKLPDMTEVDPSPNFVVVKGKVNLKGDFVEVMVKGRKNQNSLTGYSFHVTSYLPTGAVDSSSGLCMSNKNNAYLTAVPPEKNLFPEDDLALLTEACCPGGNCEPPEGPEPEYQAETLCEMCPNALSYATVKAACAESEDDPALVATCEFDACMECDLEDALESTEEEMSNEGEDNEPMILNTGGIGTSEADPHCRNIRGESFDILRMGPMQMVALPMQGEKRASLLDITAAVMPLRTDKRCSPTTIQRVDIRGSWLPSFLSLSVHPTESGILDVPRHWQDWMSRPNAHKGNLTLRVDSWMVGNMHKSVMLLKVGPVSVTIHQRKGSHTGTNYLDLDVKGLDQVGQDVGGLLGLDNHDDVVSSYDGCRNRDVAVKLDRQEVSDEDFSEEDFERMADAMHEEEGAEDGDGRLISLATAM